MFSIKAFAIVREHRFFSVKKKVFFFTLKNVNFD